MDGDSFCGRASFEQDYADTLRKEDTCELIELEESDERNPLSSKKVFRIDVEETLSNMAAEIGRLNAALEDALQRIDMLEAARMK